MVMGRGKKNLALCIRPAIGNGNEGKAIPHQYISRKSEVVGDLISAWTVPQPPIIRMRIDF
jgi:hypothetical protein